MAEACELSEPESSGKDDSNDKKFICGVVEGFYGRPWTPEQRKDLFAKMKKMGLNTYMYAPKDDFKHRAYWRELYSVEEAEHLTSLVQAATENDITFFYALSPGLDISYSNAKEILTLKRKLEQVNQFGCTAFALLFDDIEPEISEMDKEMYQSFAHAQVAVSNEIYEHLSHPRFIFCPTEYCATRAIPNVQNSEYLNTIGQKLHADIDIMWTGPKVISKDITVESIQELTEVLRRPPLIWDNLHANDYDQKRLFLGPYCGRSTNLIPRLRGVLTNPNCEYETNFVPIHTLAQWSKCTIDGKTEYCNEIITADIKLETGTDLIEDFPMDLTSNTYHPINALKLAIKEWMPEFYKAKNAFGRIINAPLVPTPTPLVPPCPLPVITSVFSMTTMPTTPSGRSSPAALDSSFQPLSSELVNSLITSKDSSPSEPMDCNPLPPSPRPDSSKTFSDVTLSTVKSEMDCNPLPPSAVPESFKAPSDVSLHTVKTDKSDMDCNPLLSSPMSEGFKTPSDVTLRSVKSDMECNSILSSRAEGLKSPSDVTLRTVKSDMECNPLPAIDGFKTPSDVSVRTAKSDKSDMDCNSLLPSPERYKSPSDVSLRTAKSDKSDMDCNPLETSPSSVYIKTPSDVSLCSVKSDMDCNPPSTKTPSEVSLSSVKSEMDCNSLLPSPRNESFKSPSEVSMCTVKSDMDCNTLPPSPIPNSKTPSDISICTVISDKDELAEDMQIESDNGGAESGDHNFSMASDISVLCDNEEEKLLLDCDLTLLVDLFYLPFEHGRQGIKILKEFHWLKAHSYLMCKNPRKKQREPENPEVQEWLNRASKFESITQSVGKLLTRLTFCPNRSLLYDLYPYIWDVKGVVSMLNSYLKWIALRRVPMPVSSLVSSPFSSFSEGYKGAFMSGDQEPWAFLGGLTAELQHLLPLDSVNDLFLYKSPDIPNNKIYTIRPYLPSDESQLYEVCRRTCNDGLDGSARYPDYPNLVGDKYIGHFLCLSPEFCFVVEDEKGICGYALAALDAKQLRRRYEIVWIAELRTRYSPIEKETQDRTPSEEIIDSFFDRSNTEPPDVVYHHHSSILKMNILPTVNDTSVPKRMLTCILSTLKANGSHGVFAEVNVGDENIADFYSKLGFLEIAHPGFDVKNVFYMGRTF